MKTVQAEAVQMRVGDLIIDPELTKLRPINTYFVSRYRQAYRHGAPMPLVIVQSGTNRVVSGNHRVTALLEEYGEDHQIKVEVREYDNERAMLEEFARENVAHGNPLEGVSRSKIAHALMEKGATAEEIAILFNVAVRRVVDWCGMTVTVIGGRSKKKHTEIIKRGPEIVGETITQPQYDTHIRADRGISAYSQAAQLTRWINQGWVKPHDHKSVDALRELASAIDTFIATVDEEAVV